MISILVSGTLALMMLRAGFDVTVAQVVATAKDVRLVAWALVVNYVFVPALTITLLLLLHANPTVAVGFLILSVCPGAPFAPSLTAIAKGRVGVSVALMTILAGSSSILAPVLLNVLLPYASTNEPVSVSPGRIFGLLVVTQLVPLFAGMALRWIRPRLAATLKKPFGLVANVLLLVVCSLIIATQYQALIDIRLKGLAAMFALSLGSLAMGWLAGGTDPGNRKAMALTTSFRNAGVGMVIASGIVGSGSILTAVVAYTLVSACGTVGPALYWSMHPPPRRVMV